MNPTSVDFGSTQIGAHSDHIINVENQSKYVLKISDVVITDLGSGTSAGEFSIIGGWAGTPLEIQPGSILTITVRFEPQTIGNKSASLQISHNAVNVGSPVSVSLTGFGAAPLFAITPTSHDYGTVNFGENVSQA